MLGIDCAGGNKQYSEEEVRGGRDDIWRLSSCDVVSSLCQRPVFTDVSGHLRVICNEVIYLLFLGSGSVSHDPQKVSRCEWFFPPCEVRFGLGGMGI